MTGRYRSWNPWAPILDVTEREGRLWASLVGDATDFGGGERELVPLPDGRYRVGEEWSPDRLRFDTFVGDRAVWAYLDGAPFVRVAGHRGPGPVRTPSGTPPRRSVRRTRTSC